MQIFKRSNSNSAKRTGFFFELKFSQKIQIIAFICLVGILLQGMLIIRICHQLQQDLAAADLSKERAAAGISSLKVSSEALISGCQSSLLAGTGLEVSDLLGKIEREIDQLPAIAGYPDLNPLKSEFRNLANHLSGYRQTGLKKGDYLAVKGQYFNYLKELNHLAQTSADHYQTYLYRPLLKEVWPFSALLNLFIVVVIMGGSLLYTAAKSIFKPARLISGALNEAGEKLFHLQISSSSAAGLGKAGLMFQEFLSYWNLVFLDSKNSIKRFDSLCRELVTEIRKTELFAIQLQKVAETIIENFQNQNKLLIKANEQLNLLSKNGETLHKIPQRLFLIHEDLQNQLIIIETQINEVLSKPVEHLDVSDEIAGLAADLQMVSGQITGIVSILKEVAGQTELLAFNTAIQAARAGEKGLGFGVVAREIAKLVGQSEKAAARLDDSLFKIQGTNEQIIALIQQNPAQVVEEIPAFEELSSICGSLFITARESFASISGLAKVMEEISVKSNALAREANLISTLAMENDDSYKAFDLEILDYRLNVKEANRMAVKTGEISEELRKLIETGEDRERHIF